MVGQRLMQGATDIFLGWQRIKGLDGVTRDYYVRQFHDWKGGANVDNLRVRGATFYARLCAATLARAHARWGDRIAIASYLGKGDAFARAIADFSVSVRRPERARLRSLHRGGQVWAADGANRRVDLSAAEKPPLLRGAVIFRAGLRAWHGLLRSSVLDRIDNDPGTDTDDHDVSDHLTDDQDTSHLGRRNNVAEPDCGEHGNGEIQGVRARQRLAEAVGRNPSYHEVCGGEQQEEQRSAGGKGSNSAQRWILCPDDQADLNASPTPRTPQAQPPESPL